MESGFEDRITVYRVREGKGIPPFAEQKAPAIYHLLLRLSAPRTLHVGCLGLRQFPPGYYIYTGSARRGLGSRLQRHLRRDKIEHWHIDRLTRLARIEEIWVDLSGKRTECKSHQEILILPGASRSIPQFGSSDCRCPSHLTHFKKRPFLPGSRL